MLKEIETRRCCRSYDKTKAVEIEKIQEVINAGLNAATAKNNQIGIIIAMTNKEVRDKLAKLNGSNLLFDTFYGAPVVLLVAAKKGDFAKLDGAAMLQNMLVEANNQGLGACWIHRAKEELESEKGRELLKDCGLDLNEYEGVGHVILGYPTKDAKPRDKTIRDDRVYWFK